jgi:hypothetical protein
MGSAQFVSLLGMGCVIPLFSDLVKDATGWKRVRGHTVAVAERQIMLRARQRLVLGQLQQQIRALCRLVIPTQTSQNHQQFRWHLRFPDQIRCRRLRHH